MAAPSGACLAAALTLGGAADLNALHRAHDGGTLRLTAHASFGSIDPAINYLSKGAEVFYPLYDQLVTFRHAAQNGYDVVPDLADAMPAVRDGGRTYVFHLRPNIRFSNGHVLDTTDVVASMVRLFKVQSPNAGAWYNIIVGGDACVTQPAACTLSGGVVANAAAGTVTFHLIRPDSEFLYKMAFPFASILPAETPTHDMGTTAPPGTGAYRVESYDPTRLLVMTRNPYFHPFSEDAQPRGFVDRIEYHYGLEEESEVTAILNNQYDWMFEPSKPLDRLTELGARYGNRVQIREIPEIFYMPLNVNMAPFNNPKARLAVAYAVDRRALVKLMGGSHLATAFCQFVPDGIPGHQPYCPFTQNPDRRWTAPDMVRARELMRASGTAGQTVTLIAQDRSTDKAMGEYLRSLLEDLGYNAKVKTISSQIQFNYIQNTNNKVQTSLTDWTADYPTASDYLQVLFACASFIPGSDNSVNMPGYCNHSIDAAMDSAQATAITDPAAANAQWAKIDRAITDSAAAVSLLQVSELDVLSTRLGNYTHTPLMHMLFACVWVQ